MRMHQQWLVYVCGYMFICMCAIGMCVCVFVYGLYLIGLNVCLCVFTLLCHIPVKAPLSLPLLLYPIANAYTDTDKVAILLTINCLPKCIFLSVHQIDVY